MFLSRGLAGRWGGQRLMTDLAIYGFGAFGRELAAIVRSINEATPRWNVIGYFDDGVPEGRSNRYGGVIGGLGALNRHERPLAVVMAIASPDTVRTLVSKITNPLVHFPNLVAPTVLFFDRESVGMGRGNILGHNCRISCDVELGDFNLLNGEVSLGHDVKTGSFNVMQPDVRLSGAVTVGDGNYFGARALVLQGVAVGRGTRIGTGSVVIRRTRDGVTYFGNPARIMRNL